MERFKYCRCITFGQQYRREKHHGIPEVHPDGWIEIHYNELTEFWTLRNRFLGNSFSNITYDSAFEKYKNYYPKGCLRTLTPADLLAPVSLTDFLDNPQPITVTYPWNT